MASQKQTKSYLLTETSTKVIIDVMFYIWYFFRLYLFGVFALLRQLLEKSTAIKALPLQSGKTAIVTGGASGIGFHITKHLVSLGAHVIIASRSRKQAESAIAKIKENQPEAEVEFMSLDLASFNSVRKFADDFLSKDWPLHILINNGGVMLVPCQNTEDGFEYHLQVNFLSHALLTSLLLDKMECSAALSNTVVSVVNVSSVAHEAANFRKNIFEGGAMDAAELHPNANMTTKLNLGYLDAALQSLSVIVVSELGDKTFFIVAILAVQHSRLSVVLGAMISNILMFILTVAMGCMMTFIPEAYIQALSSFLFIIFGLQMMKEGWRMPQNKAMKELEEAKEEIRKKEDDSAGETPQINGRWNALWSFLRSSVVVKSFSLTFLAEWGDRSQIATLLLGASEDFTGVIIGGLVGHTLCTGFAAVSGNFVAKKVSLRAVHTVGGLLFLVFGVSALFSNSND